jgi:two-component system, OmpR family, sensor histidine kinase CpxA
MTIRLPLLGRILGWFFLNLAVLGLVFLLVFHFQLRLGLESLLAGRAGERIRAVSELIVAEVKPKPVSDWSGVLKNFQKAYEVELYLFRNDGTQAAGDPVALPAEVAEKITERRSGVGLGRGPPPGRGLGRRLEVLASAPQPAFLLRGGEPKQYWAGVRLPLTDESDARPCPITLVMASPSLRAGGLLFDATPWLVLGFGALLFSVLFWLPLVRNLTRSIAQLTAATEQMAQGRFDTRVDATRADELGRLGLAINRMAERLSGFVSGQKRFLGDTAHELCSPLARMQVALGILEERADDTQRAHLADLREDIEEMAALVNELLSFSQAGLQRKAMDLQPISVASVVQRVVAREAPDTARLQLQLQEGLAVMAQPELLARALANVLRNALRYAGDAGPILLTGTKHPHGVSITIADQGPGVPESSLQQIFDPFFRGEPSRSRETGGVGLGLAIVKTCIEACQGTVSATNRQPSGLQVDILLQAASAAPESSPQPR